MRFHRRLDDQQPQTGAAHTRGIADPVIAFEDAFHFVFGNAFAVIVDLEQCCRPGVSR